MKQCLYLKLSTALKEKMKQKGISGCYIAKEIGISPSAFRSKLNGYTAFDMCEYMNVAEILKLTPEEIDEMLR